MDNANEINADFTHKEVALFLGDELKNQDEQHAVTYDLVEEYAKTAKNKKKFVWILLGICVFIVTAGTFLTAALVSKSNHRITINIDSFDDLNLRSLLNSAGRVQNLYETAVKNKQTLEENRDDELTQAQQTRENALFTLESVASVATKDSINERKIKIELDYNTEIERIKQEYEPKIAESELEIQKYKAQVDSYDKNRLSEAQGAESSLDSTKQLHDIEMKTQAERYEKKIRELRQQLVAQQIKAAQDQKNAVEEVRSIYQAKIDLLDPKAREQSSEQNKIILDAGIKNQTASSTLWHSVETLDFSTNDYTDASSSPQFLASVQKAAGELSELRTLAYRFKPIPMENSIKDYVPAMMHQTYQIASDLAKSGKNLQTELKEFESLAEALLSDRTADGIILNTKNAPSFTVYLANFSQSKVDEIGVPVQILSGNRAVAEGTLAKSGEKFILTQTLPPADEKAKNPPYQPIVGDKLKILPVK